VRAVIRIFLRAGDTGIAVFQVLRQGQEHADFEVPARQLTFALAAVIDQVLPAVAGKGQIDLVGQPLTALVCVRQHKGERLAE